MTAAPDSAVTVPWLLSVLLAPSSENRTPLPPDPLPPARRPTSAPTRTATGGSGQAISTFAKRAGFEIVAEFYDAAVSGADPIQDRPGFSALLNRIESNGVRTVIVEDASRFARELAVSSVTSPNRS